MTDRYAFPTPAELAGVYELEISGATQFLAHVIQDRLKKEKLGPRQIGMTLDPKEHGSEGARYSVDALAVALDRLTEDLQRCGWVAEGHSTGSGQYLTITLIPTF